MDISKWLLICISIMLMQGCIGQSDYRNSRRKGALKGIVGGRDSLPDVRTYQVSLQAPKHFCGGSIINSRYIISAAHCLVRQQASKVKVIAGTHKLSKPYVTYEVSKIIVHSFYDQRDSFKNDIGLLKVKTPIVFNSRVKAIPLPKPFTKVNDGEEVTVSGWGRTLNGSLVDTLQEVDIKIVNQERCKRLLKKFDYNIYDTQICTNDEDPSIRQGECNGDSGGPLVSKGVLIGIVSWSIKDPSCGSNKYPGVFTRVSKYLDWIKKVSD